MEQWSWRPHDEVVLSFWGLCTTSFGTQEELVPCLGLSFFPSFLLQFSDIHDDIAFCIHRIRNKEQGVSFSLWFLLSMGLLDPQPPLLLHCLFVWCRKILEGQCYGSVDREACCTSLMIWVWSLGPMCKGGRREPTSRSSPTYTHILWQACTCTQTDNHSEQN